MRCLNIILLIISLSSWGVQSQSLGRNIISTGNNSDTFDNYTIDWIIGDFSITTITDYDTLITQGYLQPTDIVLFNSGIPNLKISLSPNPTSDWVIANVDISQDSDVEITISDVSGRILNSKIIFGDMVFEKIDLRNYTVGTYFISFNFIQNKFQKTFKVVKQ